MKRICLLVMSLSLLAGCEAKSKFNPKEFSDEEKQKIRAEDKAVEDEESHGKGPGLKKGSGKK